MEKTSVPLPKGTLLLHAEIKLNLVSANRMTKDVIRYRKDGTPYAKRVSTNELEIFQWAIKPELGKAKLQDWKAIEHIREYMKRTGEKVPLKLAIIFYFPTLWKRDTSNYIKALEDTLLYQFLMLNDNIVVDIHAQKLADPKNPRCEIRLSVTEIGGAEW
jgi:Holliday junction resolvase RusA-like endonuclease